MHEGRQIPYNAIRRTDGNDSRHKPKLTRESQRFEKGYETFVYRSELEYLDGTRVNGLVYKQFRDGDHDEPPEIETARARLERSLALWKRLKQINTEERKAGRSGFNLPSAIRGIFGPQECGILMTDLTEGGKWPAIDLKQLIMHRDIITREAWSSVKEKVLADTELAYNNHFELTGGNKGLDPWLIVIRDKGDAIPYVVDVGQYARSHAPETMSPEEQTRLEKMRERARASLEEIESKIEEEWSRPVPKKGLSRFF